MLKKVNLFFIFALAILSACGGNGGGAAGVNMNQSGVPYTVFTITDPADLIGGPLATGRMGDVLLKNDKIRLIIEQPGKTSWVGNFGGTLVDADLVRDGSAGQDNFGFIQPLINVEWTLNVVDYEVIDTGEYSGKKVFRTYGIIDVYDYLDIDFISPVAEAMTGQKLYYAPRFDDVNDPFNLTELRDINQTVVTDYILEDGKNYVQIDTTFENTGDEEVFMPVGEFVNGGGEVMFLIPGLGFTPEMMPQIQGDTPALIYVGFDGAGTSYGYFFDLNQFVTKDENGNEERLKSTSLSYSGITGLFFGDDFLKVLPLGNQGTPQINFSVPPHGSKTITRYFVVGDGSGGSVFDTGLEMLGINKNRISGKVVNSENDPVEGATVSVKNENGAAVITYRTDSSGRFSGYLSTGENIIDKALGNGLYTLSVYKNGYKILDSSLSGECSPEEIDMRRGDVSGIECKLGPSGIVRVNGGVVDADTGLKMPARLTVAGYKPSYRSETGGDFEDKIIFERPLGVVDVYYVNAKGTIGLEEKDGIRLAPGKYDLFFTRGVEYSMERISVNVGSSAVTEVGPIRLKKVIDTTGFVSADFHLHSIYSPDSAMKPERRTLAAAGEGMDILQSSDHDYLVDYQPYYNQLVGRGIINDGSMFTIVGDEVSPNHLGHFSYFPAPVDPAKACGGALDWGYVPSDIVGPDPDYVMSPQDIVDYVRNLPGEHILQINHIADMATSLFILGGWVTTSVYEDNLDVTPLSSYADPMQMRIESKLNSANIPYSFGESEIVIDDFDTLELVIGPWLHDDLFLTSSLPQWFNLLNIGVISTATGDSDSHREIANALGLPRNFVASGVDPSNGMGDFSEFNRDEYIQAIKDHKVIVTTGPFIKSYIKNESGEKVSVGGRIKGGNVTLEVEVKSPEWAWFDTIEVYANTEPVPADDARGVPMDGSAKDPAKFHKPYHVQRFYYNPQYTFSLSDGTLEDWKNENGVITAHISLELNFETDTWVVVFARGTEGTEGYKSLFPFVTHALVDADNPSVMPEDVDMGNIDMLSLTGAPAWAFTNPIFVDVDGDGFDALYTNGSWKRNSVKTKSAVQVNTQLLK